MAGIDLPVGPRKRYIYVIDCPAATEALHKAPLTVQPSGVWFRPEGRTFICGLSPEEHEEPTVMDWEVDHAFFEDRIWANLAEHVPLFEAIKVISAWVGHYDYNALDQNAVIGAHPEVKNFYFANGFSGHGLQQGPAAGNAIAELIVHGGYRAIDLRRFGFERILRNEPLFEKNVI
jgi:sarcosine oxidase